MNKLKRILVNIVVFLALGGALGAVAKYLDTMESFDGGWQKNILPHLGDLFSRLGVWIFIATIIAAYSKTRITAALNTFMFFIGMLVSYYIYSAYLFGFFPTNYFVGWGLIALFSPLLAVIVWEGKNNISLSWILPALPIGLLLSLSIGIGLFYLRLNYLEELIMCFGLCLVFYKSIKQMPGVIIITFVVAFIVKQINPFV
ncbi:hypothetical protein WKH56_08345 [Priestia sp. SB1]|uniref:Uncharacterized protein n=1 Tax=Priestia aryabhattai TaxID=412384 RepID=A0AAX6NEW7_PRIAR|nr:hypothetical protein [Priestia aryabhattai]MDU9694045.1 hypothetical protein [Priestia aryabhattai]